MQNKRENIKSENFKKVAEKRTQKIISALDSLGNLSNKQNYLYKEEQYKNMFQAIKSAVREAENRFKTAEIEGKKLYKIPD
jgi:hypothetical protein